METDESKAASRKEAVFALVCGVPIYVGGLCWLGSVPSAGYILWPRSFPFGAAFIVLLVDIAWAICKGRVIKSRRVRIYVTTVLYALSASFFSAFILCVGALQAFH